MMDLKRQVYDYVQEQGECITGEVQKAFPQVHDRTVYDALVMLRTAGLLSGETFSTGRARSTLWKPVMPWSEEALPDSRSPCFQCDGPRREEIALYAKVHGRNRPVCAICKARIKGSFSVSGQPKHVKGRYGQPSNCRECGTPTVGRSYCTGCVAKNVRRVRQMGVTGWSR